MINVPSWTIVRAMRFGYPNARVKAMKQSLLQQRDLDAMADAASIDEVYSMLERTSYRQDLVDVSLKEKNIADQMELACTRNFSRYLKKVSSVIPKDARQVLAALFEKYEIENIKILLSAKENGQAREKTAQLILETGLLSKAIHSRMLDAKDLKAAISPLEGTVYASVIEKSHSGEKSLPTILSALDSYYFGKMGGIASNFPREEKIILGLLRSQIDYRNISMILRSKTGGIPDEKIQEFLIPGGNISREKLRQAATEKSAEAAALVFRDDFNLEAAIDAYKKTGSLIPVEIELEKGYAKKGLSVLRRSILSIGAIVGFLLIKEEEVSNIRKIIRAKEFGLPNEKIREMLVVV